MQKSKLSSSLTIYKNFLQTLRESKSIPTAANVLGALKARDRIEFLISDNTQDHSGDLLALIELDKQFKEHNSRIVKAINLSEWRTSLSPPITAWWWYSDSQIVEQKKRSESLLDILAGTLLVLNISLALEIVQRFWKNAPDIVSIWGTLLTILLTASPLVREGREVGQWFLEQVLHVSGKYRSKTTIVLSGLSLIVFLISRLWLLPGPLASYYNNSGVTAQVNGNINFAKQMFQRSTALNPDRVVPYYNLATSYQNAGLTQKAIEWYQYAIEHDANFTPAYRGLGEIYNQQGKYDSAMQILLAGLDIHSSTTDSHTANVTRYEILSNLGWSYWGLNKNDMAQIALEAAVNMETELKLLGDEQGTEYRLALPHFYLAQIYEKSGDVDEAILQWEDCLRFLDQNDWRQKERYLVAQQHLLLLTGN